MRGERCECGADLRDFENEGGGCGMGVCVRVFVLFGVQKVGDGGGKNEMNLRVCGWWNADLAFAHSAHRRVKIS